MIPRALARVSELKFVVKCYQTIFSTLQTETLHNHCAHYQTVIHNKSGYCVALGSPAQRYCEMIH